MPISKYFKGNGTKVMGTMQKEYGEKKGESVFYATANKKKMKPTAVGANLSKAVNQTASEMS